MIEVRGHHRFRPYLFLPIVAAMMLALIAGMNISKRATLISQLANVVASGSDEDATAAIMQMAAMPRPPISAIVDAAASSSPPVAAAAQNAIHARLRTYDERIQSQQSIDNVAGELNELIESLSRRQKAFSAADQAWIASTTHAALRLANQLPPHTAPALAARCEAILNATDVVELAQTAFANTGAATLHTQPNEKVFRRTPASGATEPRLANTSRAAIGAGNAAPPRPQELMAKPAQDQANAATQRSSETKAIAPNPQNILRAESPRSEWSGLPTPAITSLPDSVSMRVVPPRALAPEPAAQMPSRPKVGVATQLADVDARALLEQWLARNGVDAIAIEQELARRGFGRLSKRLVEKYFSKNADERLRLVDDVLSDPSVGARPWLILFADDSDADVRLLAVTVMATSNDRALLEKAWQVAIRDRDPRIADLAPRLRDRQGGSQRR